MILKNNIIKRAVLTLIAATTIFSATASPTLVSAIIKEENLSIFSQNSIMFYNPDECVDGATSNTSDIVSDTAVISGDSAEKKIWSGLKSLGLSDEITAGIMGNMMGESGLNPVRYEDKYKTSWQNGLNDGVGSDGFNWKTNTTEYRGLGLVGWSGPLRADIWSYTEQHSNTLAEEYFGHPEVYGKLSGDEFIKKLQSASKESDADALYSTQITYLINNLIKANDSQAKAFNYADILAQTTVEGVASSFAVNFERCATCTLGSQNVKQRTKFAQELYEKYKGQTNFGSGTTAIPASVNGADVTIIGDSITEGAKGIFIGKLSGVDIHSEVSKHFADKYPAGGDPGTTILEQLVNNNQLRSVLVFALGTNDASPTIDQADIDKVLELAKSAKQIIFVTNYLDGSPISANNQLFANAASKDSRVKVADWATVAAENSDSYFSGSEKTHPNSTGSEAFVDLIIQTIGATNTAQIADASTNNECCDTSSMPSSSGIYKGKAYNLNDTDLDTLIRIAFAEEGEKIPAMQTSLSQMANRAEKFGQSYSDVLDYVINSRWYGSANRHCSGRTCDYTASISDEQRSAAKDIILNGNRTIPLQVIEHDCLNKPDCSDITSITGPDGQTYTGEAMSNMDLFERGKTHIFNNSGAHYIFWDWANPEEKEGDPFGYSPDDPPSESATQATKGTSATKVAGSNVTWDNGWINAGLDGYIKDSLDGLDLDGTWGKDYVTDSLSGSGKGPNKITLHATEGSGTGADSVRYIYESNGGVPPHFTIDLKNHKVYQHQSILKASSAVKGTDCGDLAAGVQIEIIGYDNEREGAGHEDWLLAKDENFSADDWNYLAELLNAISVETNIPLESSVDWSSSSDSNRLSCSDFQSYTSILGHKHVPGNDHTDLEDPAIWQHIQSALSSFTGAQQTNQCKTNGADAAALQDLIKDWAWSREDPNWETPEKKPAYAQVISKRENNGDYVGSSGIDCGGFVTTLMQESGWDPRYNPNKGSTSAQLAYVQQSSKWDDVTSTIHSNADAKPGDVLIGTAETGHTPGHTLVFGGNISGFKATPLFEASVSPRWAPMESYADDIMYFISRSFHVFRNNEPPASSGVSEGGLTYEQAKTLMRLYGKNENNDSYNTMMSSPLGSPATGCTGGPLSNCVSFVAFFLNKFTSSQHPGGNGYEIVGRLGQHGVTTDSTPSVWSVFSYGGSGGPNHTGVILGKENGEWIVGQAGCRNSGSGEGDGTYEGGGAGAAVKSSDLNTAAWNSTGASMTFAHPSINTSKIQSYINGGK